MPLRPLRYAAVFWLIALPAAAQAPAKSNPSPSLAHEAIKGFKFQPPAPVAEVSAVFEHPLPREAPVMMPAYLVRALPDRTYQDLTAAFAQQQRLKSPALLKKGRLEMLFPPELGTDRAGLPALVLPIIKIVW